MIETNTQAIAVRELRAGDKVDLESCPYLKKHPTAEYEFAEVAEVVREPSGLVAVGYEGIDVVGYSPDTVLRIVQRDPEKEALLELIQWAEWVLRANGWHRFPDYTGGPPLHAKLVETMQDHDIRPR